MKTLENLFLSFLCSFLVLNSATAQGVINLLPVITVGVTALPDGAMQIDIAGRPGMWVSVEFSPDLSYWLPYPGPAINPDGTLASTGQINIYRLDETGVATVRADLSQGVAARFYRVRQHPISEPTVGAPGGQVPIQLVAITNGQSGTVPITIPGGQVPIQLVAVIDGQSGTVPVSTPGGQVPVQLIAITNGCSPGPYR